MQHPHNPISFPLRQTSVLLAAVFLGCLPGWLASDADFLADDLSLVRAGAHMMTEDFLRPWTGPWVWPGIAPDWPGYDYYRPLTVLSFGIDWMLRGLNPRGYHQSNLLLHAGCVVLFYLVALRVCGRTRGRCAAAAALVFALHPVHEYSVLWLAGRTDLLCALFYLAALFCFLSARENGSRWMPPLTALFTVMAILSKEMAYSLPLVCAALYFLPPEREEEQIPERDAVRLLAPPFLAAAALFAMRPLLFGWENALPGTPGTGPMAAFWMSARHLALPFHLSFRALLQEHTMWTTLAAAGLAMLSLPLLPGLRSRVAAAGIAWTLLALLPAARLFMPWYMYIPSAGFSLLLGHLLGHGTGWRRAPAAALAVVVAGACAAQWHARVPVWQEAGELARDVATGVLAEGGERPIVLLAPASVGDVPVHAHNLPARLALARGAAAPETVVSAYAWFPAGKRRHTVTVTPVDAHNWEVALSDPEAFFVFPAGPPGTATPWGTVEVLRREPLGAPVALRVTLTPETAASATGVVYYSAGEVRAAPRPAPAEQARRHCPDPPGQEFGMPRWLVL